jgi:ferredoxin-thioredoxin reductase catalytic subunit
MAMKKDIKGKINVCDGYAEVELLNANGVVVGVSKIDIEDIEKVNKFRWILSSSGYAQSNKGGFRLLHRYILNLNKCKRENDFVDHINGDPLDNRKANLRLCNLKENARNTRNQHITESGVIGVRKDNRCKNSWRAQIYFNRTDHIEKTYKDKELAIIQRLIWELKYFKEFAPQIELIKSKYPYLMGYNLVCNDMDFSENISLIKKIGDRLLEDPHCPCSLKKDDTTICPCDQCQKNNECHCGIFEPLNQASKNDALG